MTTVLLLRHGETDLNVRDVLRGHVDAPLSANGVRQARRFAERVAHEYRVSALHSSPLQRARSTAQAIAEATGVAIEIEDRFLDIDYGPWAGKLCDSFSAAEREEFRRWHRHPEVPLAGRKIRRRDNGEPSRAWLLPPRRIRVASPSSPMTRSFSSCCAPC